MPPYRRYMDEQGERFKHHSQINFEGNNIELNELFEVTAGIWGFLVQVIILFVFLYFVFPIVNWCIIFHWQMLRLKLLP